MNKKSKLGTKSFNREISGPEGAVLIKLSKQE